MTGLGAMNTHSDEVLVMYASLTLLVEIAIDLSPPPPSMAVLISAVQVFRVLI